MTTEAVTQSELDDLRSTLRDYFGERLSDEALRKIVATDSGYDLNMWRELSQQLGLVSLYVPSEFGGDGYSFIELKVVLEEMGRVLLPCPFLSTAVLSVSALLGSDDLEAQARYLPGIAEGMTTAAFAVAEHTGGWDVDDIATTGQQAADGSWSLNGHKAFVIDGASADLILVVAVTEHGPSLFSVSGDASGLRRAPMRTLDLTRRLAALEFDDVTASLVGRLGDAGRVVDYVADRLMVAMAAEQLGAARACLDASSAYARDRVQFGRPIGSFQAIKHKLADMLVRVSLAEAAVTEAADALAEVSGAPEVPTAAALAHVVCSEALMFVAAENIQVHGGIGFTWEHPAHLYFRRAKSAQLLLGGPAVYYERLLNRMGL